MAHKEYKILLKTLADISGVSKLSAYLQKHKTELLALKGTYKAVGAAGKAAFSLISAELRFLRNAALGGAGALAVAVREGIKLNVPLSQTVNMFSGNKLANFAKFRTEILNLSSTTGIAAGEINKALYQAGSAQLAPDQSLVAIRKAIQGVVADGGALPDVLGGIIAGIKNFGGDVDQTAEKLYRIVQLGQTNFTEVGGYLNTVGSTAAANKVTLDEVGGAMAQLTSKTIPTSTAFIQLSNIMGRLNNILGDNWHDTRTLQDALEEVAKSTGYSQSKMMELFGIESNRVIQAMVGKNFADAKRQLGEFKGQLTGLAAAARFSDQFRGWAKVWQSMRNYVTEIGSAIEQRWAPRIQFIADKINEMRKGEAFQTLVDRLSDKLEKTVTWVIVQVKTASDLITHLRSQNFGLVRMAEVAKSVVVELITLAVSLLLALLKANMAVFIGLAKIIAAAFKKEILDVIRLLPFMKDKIANMALDKLESMDNAGKNELAKSLGYADKNSMVTSDEFRSGSLDSAILAFQSSAEVIDAMSDAAGKLKETLKDVDEQWTKSKARIKASADQASGGGFDWDATAAENRKEVENFMPPPTASKPTSQITLQKTPEEIAQEENDAIIAEIERHQAQKQIAAAKTATPEEQQLARHRQRNAGRNFAPNSFSAREEQNLQKAAEASRKEANKAAEEAVAALNAITGMMTNMSGAIKKMQSQVQKAGTI